MTTDKIKDHGTHGVLESNVRINPDANPSLASGSQ